jgi:DNA invertase Pin-like site-specific DNA recombinase
MPRALGIIRLSLLTDESTSVERQQEIIEAEARKRGSSIAGWAKDTDVSASKFPPTKRPELAPWLARPEEYDELIFWRIDRLARKVGDFADMVRWADEHGKGLASATEPFDLASPLGRALAYLIAIFAEMEAAAISERVTGAHAYLRREGRWAGGRAPFGHRAVKNPSGPGHVLAIDEAAAAVCQGIVQRAIQGEAVNAIAADLNRRNVLSPTDHARVAAGRPVTGSVWRGTNIVKILRNPALLGYVVHKRAAVTGDDGTPIVRAPAIITETEWDRLQHALNAPERRRDKRRTQTPNLLLHVAYCALCEAPYTVQEQPRPAGGYYSSYRCRNHARPGETRTPCPAKPINVQALNELTEQIFLGQVGAVEILERIYRPGVDHSDEIALLHRSLETVRDEYDAGDYSYPGGEDAYRKRLTRLTDRLRGLADLPVTESAYEYRSTGQTFADRWRDSDTQARRQLMINAAFQLRVSRTPTGEPLDAALRDELVRKHERSLRGVLLAAGVTEIRRDAWDEVRKLVDPHANLVIAFQLDPDLARRAGLAAEGRPVTAPDAEVAWQEVLAPVREHLAGR